MSNEKAIEHLKKWITIQRKNIENINNNHQSNKQMATKLYNIDRKQLAINSSILKILKGLKFPFRWIIEFYKIDVIILDITNLENERAARYEEYMNYLGETYILGLESSQQALKLMIGQLSDLELESNKNSSSGEFFDFWDVIKQFDLCIKKISNDDIKANIIAEKDRLINE